MSFLKFTRCFRPAVTRRFASSLATRSYRTPYRSLAWGTAFGVAACLAMSQNTVHLDSLPDIQDEAAQDTVGKVFSQRLAYQPTYVNHSGPCDVDCLPKSHADPFEGESSSTGPRWCWRPYGVVSRHKGLLSWLLRRPRKPKSKSLPTSRLTCCVSNFNAHRCLWTCRLKTKSSISLKTLLASFA